MAPPKQIYSSPIISAVSLILIMSCLVIESYSSSDKVDDEAAPAGSFHEVSLRHTTFDDLDDERVSVSLYYESLCPYCANFIVHQLVKLFTTDIGSIVNLRLIPWGNTQTTANNNAAAATWICQHGSDECLLNLVEACAISSWNIVEMQFRMVYCIERLHLENRHSEWESCFPGTGLSEAPVRDCLSNGVGTFLEEAYAAETASLNPTHTFVPWVVVNNQPLEEDYENFESYICRAYMGSRTPEACKKSLSSGGNTVKKMSSTTPRVCDRQ